MRSDEALTAELAPNTVKSWTPEELGLNNIPILMGVTRIGNWVSVKGYRRIGICVQNNRACTVHVLARINGISSVVGYQIGSTSTAFSTSANEHRVQVLDVCFDECAIAINNNEGTDGAVTCTLCAIP